MDTHSFSSQVEVLSVTDSGRRRRWSAAEKIRIVEESLSRPRSVALTAAGHVYFEHAVRILNDLEYANQEVRDQTGEPRGVLRISLPVSFSRLHIAPLLPPFLAAIR